MGARTKIFFLVIFFVATVAAFAAPVVALLMFHLNSVSLVCGEQVLSTRRTLILQSLINIVKNDHVSN